MYLEIYVMGRIKKTGRLYLMGKHQKDILTYLAGNCFVVFLETEKRGEMCYT